MPPDILWRHPVRGTAIIWLMSSSRPSSGKSDECSSPTAASGRRAAVADYNGDNKSDILWRNRTNGQMQVWLMDGKVKTASGGASAGPGAGFLLAGKGAASSEAVFPTT